jgi:4-amino-4-deoxy-L-arabinose transferase-like glycosyltransferase
MMDKYIHHKTLRYILYSLVFLPIFIFRDFTPDNELRYLSIADEALRNGSVFTFTNHGLIYADKPPLYLWIVMLGKSVFEHHSMLFLSLFSFFPALVVVYIMDKWVAKFLTESDRLAAQLMLLTSGFFIGTALVLRMDMLMCMFIVLALYTFFRMHSGEGKPRDSILFPVYVFMALFTKGPVGIIVPLISTIVFLIWEKESGAIVKYWGWKTLGILLVLCGAWFAGVYAEGGSEYLNNLLFKQTVNRAVNSFHHQEPFYYYFISVWYSLAPWSLLLIPVFGLGLKKRMISTDLERFFLVIIISTFSILSLFSSKLAVYLLPIFPFFIYLSVLWLKQIEVKRWMFILTGIPAGLLCLAFPGVIVSKSFIGHNDINSSAVILLAALVLSVSGALVLRYLIKQQLSAGLITFGTGILLTVFVVSFAVPRLNPQIGLNQLCNQAKETALKKGEMNYYYCEMSRAENIDVYLGIKPTKLRIKDLYETDAIKTPAILFTWNKAIERNDSLQTFIKDKKISRTGTFYYIEIE